MLNVSWSWAAGWAATAVQPAGTRFLASAATVTCLALGPASCGWADEPGDERRASEATADVRPLVAAAAAPPETIPETVLVTGSGGRVAGEVVYSAWIIDGALAEEEVSNLSDLAAVNLGDRPSVQIEVDTQVPPAFVYVLAYTTTDESGIPTDEGTRQRCEAVTRNSSCSYTADDESGIVIHAPLHPANRLLVLNLAWYVPESSREEGDLPTEVSASWAFAIERR